MARKGFFDEYFREFEEMDKVFERLFRSLRTGEISGKEGPLYYGFSMHIGPEGVPKITHFGNIKPQITGELIPESREPFSDVIVDEEKNQVIITLEMPGIDKKDIKLETTEDFVEVKAESEERKYYTKIPLDVQINTETASASYNNGVLEIKAKLKTLPKKGREIKVE